MYFFILLEVHIWDWRASIFEWKGFGKIKVCPPKSKVDSHLLIALEFESVCGAIDCGREGDFRHQSQQSKRAGMKV